METRIVSLLENDANISAQISNRIYPLAVPETGDLPAIIYTTISHNTEHEFSEVNAIKKQRLQLTVWSNSYATSKAISKDVVAFFDGYKSEYDGIKFHSVFLDNVVDLYNSDLKEYGNNIDLIINYEELQ